MFFIFQPRCLNVWRSATTEPAAGMAWRGISLLPDHASSSRRAVRRAAASALTRSGPRTRVHTESRGRTLGSELAIAA
jgi:hypothetical protein